MGSIKQLGHEHRVARQAVSRGQKSDDGGERVSRGHPEQRGKCRLQGGFINHGGDRCISFGGMRIDREVGTEVIERLQPLGIEAALAAQAARRGPTESARRAQ
jgi:hypothetical protein